MDKINKLLENPLLPIVKVIERYPELIKSDQLYLSVTYWLRFHKRINWHHPETFNEKLQWLKLYNHKDIYTIMVDKYLVRGFISDNIKMIPLLGVWDDVKDININELPDRFVLKPTHDSGSVIICEDKKIWNAEKSFRRLKKACDRNYYLKGREWPYKNVRPRIIAEQYMEPIGKGELYDYKMMCFNGKVEMSFVVHNRFKKGGIFVDFYDREWKRLPFTRHHPSSNITIPKPVNYEKMIELSEYYSKDIPFLRVDFYEINGELYFGEFTFFPGGGLESFQPSIWDKKLGDLIKLPID